MHEIAARSQVLVYEDEGINKQSSEALVAQLRALLDATVSIQKVGSTYLNNNPWEDKTIALVVGVGRCTRWERCLGESGMHNIRNYVLGGGKYIGFCAGAYFASAESHFSSLQKNRPLAFFTGKAIGPLFDTEHCDFTSPEAARAAKIDFTFGDKTRSGYMYYQGGCRFEIDQETPDTRIVGTYEDLRPAAVHCKVGMGEAFLCGLHPEFAWSEEWHQSTLPLAQTLCAQEPFRKQLWKKMGKMLSLPLKKQKSCIYSLIKKLVNFVKRVFRAITCCCYS